ncbi:VOC family protein [Deinococcus pimensis]|uniref:VOC family protein n=1 Tax=Deinococcus pimensis TaxID=309888 RepID=UPI00048352FC|nr:VOC family protein [Deinococcus pimensis]
MTSPIIDLAGITVEVNHLARGVRFYSQVFGLPVEEHDEERGVATLRVNDHQTLTLWKPVTRRWNDEALAPLMPRGASHLHFAWQVLPRDLPLGKEILAEHGLTWTEIDLGTPERPDPTVYFFDPFGHGLELRGVDLADERRPHFPPTPVRRPAHALPVMGLREAAIAFSDYHGMLERLPRAYGFEYVKEQEDRDFAQFVLGPSAEPDGNGTPRRWLYCWDPQVGLADMFGGDHATLTFYADVEAVARRVEAARLPCVRDGERFAARDPEGHVFVFVPDPR